eukprot:TRINITY_DN28200_c0_g1_i1.p1 TRINITY_DN28200_c0_g1~~TRINITY_DN28200_c0_g1_i1.p1  ORF type:complete len:153 (-),score=33.50 TRINITY_DN28200_c0_g1_i1:162-620(-)
MKDKEYWIKKFDLQPHPKEEKGYFKETFRDEFQVTGTAGKSRSASTLIYFLHLHDTLQPTTTFFKVQSVESIHWYYGDPVNLYYIDEAKKSLEKVVLGEEDFHFCFPRDTWFTRLCEKEDGYALVGASVAPGFDFEDLVTTEFQTLQHLLQK